MGFAIDWSGYAWIGNGSGNAAYTDKFKMTLADGQAVVNIQQPVFATAPGIYTTFPAGISACSLSAGSYDIQGAGMILHVAAFTAQETEVTVTHGTGVAVFTVYYADGTTGGGGGDPDPDPDPTPEPDPNSYTAGGHTITLDASYVDDIYTLVISSTDNMEGLGGSFWNVNGVGADMRTNSGTSSYTVSGDKKTITCQVQSSSAPNIYTPLYVLMPGEVNFGSVTLNWENRTPITSEYCNYQGPETHQDTHYYAITWETDPSGNVVITIGNGTGAGACSFRNGGFEGGNNGLDNFVVSDDDFATTSPATDYFTVTRPSDGDLQYVMTKIADLPANAKIKHLSAGAIAWREAGTDRWCWPEFTYTYGGVCAEEKVLTEISLSAASKFAMVDEDIALTVQPLDQMGKPIEATVDLEVSPADAGAIVGNVFTFSKTGAATITAKSGDIQNSITLYCVPSANLALNQPSEGGYYDNNPGEGFDKANDGNNNTAWVTYADKPASVEWWYVDLGAIYSLTGVNVLWGEPSSTSYKLYARTEAPSEDDKANDAAWEEIASVSGIGINSEQFNVVSVNARYVRVHSLTKSANFLRMKEVSVFGTEFVPVEDTEKPVMTSASLESATFTEAVINVAATDNVGVYRFHVVDATNEIDANFTPSEGKITITGLTHGTDYNFTITAIDAAGLESENNAVVPVSIPFNTEINLALNQPVVAGYTPDNAGEVPAKANDGNLGTPWTTWNNRPMDEQWWSVDLGSLYQLSAVELFWADRSDHYLIQVAQTEPTDRSDDSQWFTALEVDETQTTGNAEENKNHYSLNVSARYVRFKAVTMNGTFLKLWEFRVFGSGRAEVDTEAPVMTSASLVSNTDSRAIIAVAATDNQGIANYHVVDAGNSIDANFVAEAGNITITGLTGGTNYTFVITAVDYFGNESANSKSVAVTTAAHYTAPQAACAAPTWPANQVKAMYSPNYEADCGFDAWGSGTVYTQETYGKKYVLNNNGYFGMVGFSLNCLMMEKLHYDIWIADDATIRFVPIWGGAEQGITKSLTGQQWNSIDIDMADYTTITNWGNIYQMKIDQAYNLTFWVANAYFYRETAIVDTEAPTAFTASVAEVGFYSVKVTAQASDNSGAVNFAVKNGEEVLATGAAATATPTTITVSNLASGTAYNLSVVAYDDANNTTSPIALNATTKFVPAPIVPDFNAKDVLPVFTDAMACVVSGIHSGGWGETTQHEWLQIAPNDKVFYAQNFNFAGWHSWGGGNIDASAMDFLHVDIYSTGMTQVNVTPISPGPVEGSATITLTPNTWTSADIPLSAYAANNIDLSNIFQFKFMGAVGGNELMIDNVYFFRYQAKSNVDGWATFASPVAVKVPSGVTVYKAVYEKDGDDEILRLTPAGDVIPANTGALLQCVSESTNYPFDLATSAEAEAAVSAFSGNDLVGCAVKTDISDVAATHDIFALRHSDLFGYSGFFLYSGTIVNAGKAYLPLPKDDATPAPSRRVRFVIDATDAATAIDANALEATHVTKFVQDGQLFILRDNVVYTVQGERVK